MASSVAIEQRRKDLERQRGRHEQGVALERAEHDLAKLARGGRVLRQLQVALGARRLAARGDAAVDPLGLFQQTTAVRDLIGREDIRNVKQHRGPRLT
jgi:hypothetical protein